jgi:hypothetical protein
MLSNMVALETDLELHLIAALYVTVPGQGRSQPHSTPSLTAYHALNRCKGPSEVPSSVPMFRSQTILEPPFSVPIFQNFQVENLASHKKTQPVLPRADRQEARMPEFYV